MRLFFNKKGSSLLLAIVTGAVVAGIGAYVAQSHKVRTDIHSGNRADLEADSVRKLVLNHVLDPANCIQTLNNNSSEKIKLESVKSRSKSVDGIYSATGSAIIKKDLKKSIYAGSGIVLKGINYKYNKEKSIASGSDVISLNLSFAQKGHADSKVYNKIVDLDVQTDKSGKITSCAGNAVKDTVVQICEQSFGGDYNEETEKCIYNGSNPEHTQILQARACYLFRGQWDPTTGKCDEIRVKRLVVNPKPENKKYDGTGDGLCIGSDCREVIVERICPDGTYMNKIKNWGGFDPDKDCTKFVDSSIIKSVTESTTVGNVDCDGAWSACVAGQQVYSINRKPSGTGAACEATHNQKKTCSVPVPKAPDCTPYKKWVTVAKLGDHCSSTCSAAGMKSAKDSSGRICFSQEMTTDRFFSSAGGNDIVEGRKYKRVRCSGRGCRGFKTTVDLSYPSFYMCYGGKRDNDWCNKGTTDRTQLCYCEAATIPSECGRYVASNPNSSKSSIKPMSCN